MRIGIFGGSFNPPHNGHRDIGLMLTEKGYLEQMIYVPTGDAYNKRDLIGFKDRLNMLKLMIVDYDKLGLSDIGNSPDHQYTYQVLDYFKRIYFNDDIYFICGADNLAEFNTWRNYQYILDNYKLVVINRVGTDIDKVLEEYDEYRDRIVIADIEANVLSSTYIRNNINSEDVNRYLDDDVLEYIEKNGLYRRKIK